MKKTLRVSAITLFLTLVFAVICLAAEPLCFVFNTDETGTSDKAARCGFTLQHGDSTYTTTNCVKNGYWQIDHASGLSKYPYMDKSLVKSGEMFDAADYRYVIVCMSTRSPSKEGAPKCYFGQVNAAGTGYVTPTEDTAVVSANKIPVSAEYGPFTRYIFDMKTNENWTGSIAYVRFNMNNRSNVGYKIKYILLADSTDAVPPGVVKKEYPDVAWYSDFKYAADEDGWIAENVTDAAVTEGVYAGKTDGSTTPMLTNSTLSIDADLNKYVGIRMAYTFDDPTVVSNIRVSFTTSDGGSGSIVCHDTMSASNLDNTLYRIDMSDVAAWKGTVRSVSITPFTVAGTFRIDDIFFAATETAEDAVLPIGWYFETDGDKEGWSRNSNYVDPLTVDGGELYVNSTGSDPYISHKLECDAAEYPYIKIKWSYSLESEKSQSPRIYFTTAASPTPDETKTLKTDSIVGEGTVTTVFNCTGNTSWTGTVTSVRFDPFGCKGQAVIDSIELLPTLPKEDISEDEAERNAGKWDFNKLGSYKRRAVYAGQFTDMAEGDEHFEAAKTLYEYGILTPDADGNVNVNESVTLVEGIEWACKLRSGFLLEETIDGSAEYAAENGITCDAANEEGGFLTRTDLAVLLFRAIPLKGLPEINTIPNIADALDEDPLTRNALLTLLRAGVLTAKDEYGTVGLHDTVTRGELIDIAYRVAEKTARVSGVSTNKTYRAASLTINGTDIASFGLSFDADDTFAAYAANAFAESIADLTGTTLGNTGAHSIIFRNDATVGDRMYRIYAENGNIIFAGKDMYLCGAVGRFINDNLTLKGANNAVTLTVPADAAAKQFTFDNKAKNVLLLIGDGMGKNEVRYFAEHGGTFRGLTYDHIGTSKTSPIGGGITDSGAGGTALSCGYKTLGGYVGVDKDKKPMKNLVEYANERGSRTGVLTNDGKTGATPASFTVHVNSRNDTELIGIRESKVNADYFKGSQVSTLISETSVMLDTVSRDDLGFFAMIEESYPDTAGHNNDFNTLMTAMTRFSPVIDECTMFAYTHPDTVVIITADHETGGLTKNDDGSYAYTLASHSAADVDVFAIGAGTELFDGKTVENSEIGQFMIGIFTQTEEETPALSVESAEVGYTVTYVGRTNGKIAAAQYNADGRLIALALYDASSVPTVIPETDAATLKVFAIDGMMPLCKSVTVTG